MIDDVLYAYSYAVAVVHGKQRTMTSGHDGEMAEDDGVNGRDAGRNVHVRRMNRV